MKRHSISLALLMGISSSFLSANKVAPISNEVVTATISELEAQDKLRTKVRWLTLGAVMGTAGYVGYKWYYQEDPKKLSPSQEEQAAQLKELKRQLDELKSSQKAAEKPPAAPKEQDPWYERWPKGAWNKVCGIPSGIVTLLGSTKGAMGHILPGFMANVLLSYSGMPFFRYLTPAGMKVSDYLFLPHTITWFVSKKINLYRTFGLLIEWIGQDKKEDVNIALSKEEITLKVNTLVRDIEQILGFMRYVTAQIPATNTLEIQTSESIQSKLHNSIGYLSKRVNDFVETEHQQAEYASKALALSILIKGTLFGLINALEDFEFVQKAAGYEDIEPTRTFKRLRLLVKPENISEDKEKIKKMISKELVGVLRTSPLAVILGM